MIPSFPFLSCRSCSGYAHKISQTVPICQPFFGTFRNYFFDISVCKFLGVPKTVDSDTLSANKKSRGFLPGRPGQIHFHFAGFDKNSSINCRVRSEYGYKQALACFSSQRMTAKSTPFSARKRLSFLFRISIMSINGHAPLFLCRHV